MIQVEKRKQEPVRLTLQDVHYTLAEHREVVKRDGKVKSVDFKSTIWLDDQVRKALWMDQHKKCCYCEQSLEFKRESDVEHFRPKAGVTEAPDHSGYWWLAYAWFNLLYACKNCNQGWKKNFFPLIDETQRAAKEGNPLSNENPYLLNPVDNNPEEFLMYMSTSQSSERFWVWMQGSPTDDTKRGIRTIEICGLNRARLLEMRGEKYPFIRSTIRALDAGIHFGNQTVIDEAKKQLKRLISPESTFSGMARYFVKQAHLEDYVRD